MTKRVKDFMSTPVTSCTIEANVGKVRDLMQMKGFSALPVVDIQGEQITMRGIVTYRDIAGVYDDTINVQQVMTQRVWAIPPKTKIETAADLMCRKEIHHLVVIDNGQVVGMLSSADFVSIVAKYQFC
ncbi:MAG: CBS domain-containing protein [Saprospiraceae bacterium]|nr:CBS domain-containing protein [Saprospiraceae bacterium]